MYLNSEGVSFQNVTFRNPGGEYLAHELNFDLPKGKSMIVMGPSGCGKSSILRILAGLWIADKGTIRRPTAPNDIFFLPQRPCIVLVFFLYISRHGDWKFT